MKKHQLTAVLACFSLLCAALFPASAFAAAPNWTELGALGVEAADGNVTFSGKTSSYVVYQPKTDFKDISFDLKFDSIPAYMDGAINGKPSYGADVSPYICFVLSDLTTMSEYQTKNVFSGIYMVLYLKNDKTISLNVFSNTPEAQWQAVAIADLNASVTEGGRVRFSLSESGGEYTLHIGSYETSFELPGALGADGAGYFHVGSASGPKLLDIGFTLESFHISAPGTGALADVQKMPEDINNTRFAEDIRLLVALGVSSGYEDGTFRPENTLTRAEFAAQLVRMLGLSGGSGETPFSDVPADHWASFAISAAYYSGLVSGVGDGKFDPEAPVRYNEAVKMLVGATGYGYAAEQSGGFPDGYLTLAARNDITKNIGQVGGADYVSRGMAARLLANTLTAPYLKMQGAGSGTATYVKGDDVTILSEELGITKKKGMVRATQGKSLDGVKPLPEGFIQLDDAIYQMARDFGGGLLGASVEYYVDEDEQLVLWVRSLDNRNQRTVISAEEINSVRRAGLSSALELEYEQDGRIDTETIPADVDVTVNGGSNYKETLLEALSALDTGSIELLDNDSDGEPDLVAIETADVVVVDSVFLADETITDLYGNHQISLSGSDYTIKKGGKNFKLTAIGHLDVLKVRQTKLTDSKSTFVIEVLKPVSTGEITELSSTGATIGEQSYEHSRYFKRLMDNGLTLRLGNDAKLYLEEGRLLYLDAGNYSNKYAYLIAMAKGQGGVNNEPALKLFTVEGKLVTADVAPRVTINGSKLSNEHVFDAGLGLCTVDPATDAVTVNHQVIQCAFNASGQIRSIITAGHEDFTMDTKGTNVLYTAPNNSMDSRVYFKPDTKVMMVPADKQNEAGYFVADSSYLLNDQGYTFTSYDQDEFNNASFLLIESTSDSASRLSYADSFVVGRVSEALYEDEAAWMVSGVSLLGYREYYVKDLSVITNKQTGALYEMGDVVKIYANVANEIVTMDPLIASVNDFHGNVKSALPETTSLRGGWTVMKGNVVRMDGATKKIIVDDNDADGAKNWVVSTAGSSIAHVDTKKKETKAGKVNDIGENSYTIMIIQESVVKLMVVYE